MSATAKKLPLVLARVLDRVRKRDLAMKLAEFPVCLVTVLAVAWSVQALADTVFRFSWKARAILLAIDGLAACWLFWRYALQPWLKRMDRRRAALFIEREIPELRSSLISAVELTHSGAPPQSMLLVKKLVEDVTATVKKMKILGRVIHPERLKKLSNRMLVALALAIFLLVIGWPTSGLLFRRVLLSKQGLPPRTTVVSVTKDLLVAEDADVTLTALAQGVLPPDGRLVVMREGKAPEVISLKSSSKKPGEFSQQFKGVKHPFRYRFEVNDGVGALHQVVVQYSPELEEARFTQIFPAYTGLPDAEMKVSDLNLLENSVLRIEGKTSRSIRSGAVVIEGAGPPTNNAFRPGSDPQAFKINLNVTSSRWEKLSIRLEGVDGVPSKMNSIYPLRIMKDRPPSVIISAPRQEVTAVATDSVVRVTCEATDDFGLKSVDLVYRVMKPTAGGQAEQTATGRIPFELKPRDLSSKPQLDWQLTKLSPPLAAGDSIVFRIEATDYNSALKTAAEIEAAKGRSAERTLVCVSAEQKRLELIDQLAQKAQELEELSEKQRDIGQRTKQNQK